MLGMDYLDINRMNKVYYVIYKLTIIKLCLNYNKKCYYYPIKNI